MVSAEHRRVRPVLLARVLATIPHLLVAAEAVELVAGILRRVETVETEALTERVVEEEEQVRMQLV
jgi:hypothetical protein